MSTHPDQDQNTNCIFCKIINKKIPAEIIYEDENLLSFKDIHPKAPVHLLIITKKHIHSLAHLSDQDLTLMGTLTLKLQDIAKSQGLNHGFKIMINTGKAGGQEVDHVHYHLLGDPKK